MVSFVVPVLKSRENLHLLWIRVRSDCDKQNTRSKSNKRQQNPYPRPRRMQLSRDKPCTVLLTADIKGAELLVTQQFHRCRIDVKYKDSISKAERCKSFATENSST